MLRFEKSKVMAHPRVVQFYNKLYSAESALRAKKVPDISEFAHSRSVKGAAVAEPVERKGAAEVIDLDEDEEEAAAAAMAFA